MAPEAHLIVELGAGMADPVAAVFAAAGLAIRAARPDLNGVPRALILRRGPSKAGGAGPKNALFTPKNDYRSATASTPDTRYAPPQKPADKLPEGARRGR